MVTFIHGIFQGDRMKKIKLCEIIAVSNTLRGLIDQKLKPSFSYKLLMIIEKINSSLTAVEVTKSKMLESHGGDEEKTLPEYVAFLNETESETEFQTITIKELEESGAMISPNELKLLSSIMEGI